MHPHASIHEKEIPCTTLLRPRRQSSSCVSHSQWSAARTRHAGWSHHTSDYLCLCSEFRRENVGVYDFCVFDQLWHVTISMSLDRCLKFNRYSELGSNITNTSLWQLLSRDGAYFSRWNEFRHTEHSRRSMLICALSSSQYRFITDALFGLDI